MAQNIAANESNQKAHSSSSVHPKLKEILNCAEASTLFWKVCRSVQCRSVLYRSVLCRSVLYRSVLWRSVWFPTM